ncbi:hypothetical protein [Microbacterium sp.]|jgi:hypothetical protein|uniref:hypothetical protein n=1 Tax=Microbacterium sp. TaxID=51671 RepID=UPI002C1FD8FA|nr:hypothetical protein [Microbacterium sp.]HWL76572.1 hypothetical protein [Microbacterium sp.]
MHHDGTPMIDGRLPERPEAGESSLEPTRRSFWARLADDLTSLPASATIRLNG